MKRTIIPFLMIIIMLFAGCSIMAPNRRFQFTEQGITDGTVEYNYLPKGWKFDSDLRIPIGRIKNTVLYALDPDERFVQPQKLWYEDMDYSISSRSDVTLPDVMDENSEIILIGDTAGSDLVLSGQACAEFRMYSQSEDDTISGPLRSEITSNSKPIATIWIRFPQIEGLMYRSELIIYYYQESLYFIELNGSMEIPKDTAFYREVCDWLTSQD